MMNSEINRIAAKIQLPVMLVFSLVILFRGHNEPGGGFIGGLLLATGFLFYTIAFGVKEARRKAVFSPFTWMAAGVFLVLLSAIAGWITRDPLLTGKWFSVNLPLIDPVKIGSPLLFDTGIFLAVTGMMSLIFFTISEELKWK